MFFPFVPRIAVDSSGISSRKCLFYIVCVWPWSQYILYCVPHEEFYFYYRASKRICHFPYLFTNICKGNPICFWFCEWICLLCFCFFWGGNLLINFTSYSLLRYIFLIVLYSVYFALSVTGYVCNRLSKQLMPDRLCSYGWHELLGIIMSVWVGFRNIENCKFLWFRCIPRFRKLMNSCCSSSMAKSLVSCSLLYSSVWSIFVLFWSYIMNITWRI
jgi:hypothetical protein